jgi:hypothetical protein
MNNTPNVGGISASASTEPSRIVKPSLVDALSLIHPTMPLRLEWML